MGGRAQLNADTRALQVSHKAAVDSEAGSLLAGLDDQGSDSESDEVDADGGEGAERGEAEQEGVREDVMMMEGAGRGGGAGMGGGNPPPNRQPSLDWLLQATLNETMGEGGGAGDGGEASAGGGEGSPRRERETTPILEGRREQVCRRSVASRGVRVLLGVCACCSGCARVARGRRRPCLIAIYDATAAIM